MNRAIILSAALILTSTSALADGNGAVTDIPSQLPNNPNCLVWSTNNGPKFYGVSINSPTAWITGMTVNDSFLGLCTITFQTLSTIDPDCPNNVTAVNKVHCQ